MAAAHGTAYLHSLKPQSHFGNYFACYEANHIATSIQPELAFVNCSLLPSQAQILDVNNVAISVLVD